MGSPANSKVSEIAVTSIKVERGKLDQLKKIAEAQHRSVSQQIRFLIDSCIKDSERNAA